MEYKHNPVKAIREKCLDCCGGSTLEVKECTAENCPIYPFRLGKNPFRQKRELTEEQRRTLTASEPDASHLTCAFMGAFSFILT